MSRQSVTTVKAFAKAPTQGRVIDLVKMTLASIRAIDVDELPRSGFGKVSADEVVLLQKIVPPLVKDYLASLESK